MYTFEKLAPLNREQFNQLMNYFGIASTLNLQLGQSTDIEYNDEPNFFIRRTQIFKKPLIVNLDTVWEYITNSSLVLTDQSEKYFEIIRNKIDHSRCSTIYTSIETNLGNLAKNLVFSYIEDYGISKESKFKFCQIKIPSTILNLFIIKYESSDTVFALFTAKRESKEEIYKARIDAEREILSIFSLSSLSQTLPKGLFEKNFKTLYYDTLQRLERHYFENVNNSYIATSQRIMYTYIYENLIDLFSKVLDAKRSQYFADVIIVDGWINLSEPSREGFYKKIYNQVIEESRRKEDRN